MSKESKLKAVIAIVIFCVGILGVWSGVVLFASETKGEVIRAHTRIDNLEKTVDEKIDNLIIEQRLTRGDVKILIQRISE